MSETADLGVAEPHYQNQIDDATFSPIRICEIDLSQPLPEISAAEPVSGQVYRRCLAMVRLHDQPLGLVNLVLDDRGISPKELAGLLWGELAPAIIAHLASDGCARPANLSPDGLTCASEPRCLVERKEFLNTAPFASVVIATHDRTDSLAETLHSLLEMEYPRFEIIVVDNAPSSDQTANFIRQTFGSRADIQYVREDYHGLSVAHNRGLQEVNAPFVAFTDDDVIVDRHWLTELMRGFLVTERVACVTGMIFPAELETPAQEWIEQFGGFSKGFTSRVFDLKENRIASPLYPFAAGWFGSGASMAFDTHLLKEMGGFDPSTGAGTLAQGGDDLSAFFQVITDGYRLVYQPSAILKHWHRREYSGLLRQAYGYGVGLTAFLTKTLLDHPLRVLSFISRIPYGLAYYFGSHSRKNAKKRSGYPRELNRLEIKGMLYGPLAYLRSRRRARQAGLYPPPKSHPKETDPILDSMQKERV